MKHPDVKRILGCTLDSAWLVLLSTSNVKASSQQCVLISSSTRLLVFHLLIYLICSILQSKDKAPKITAIDMKTLNLASFFFSFLFQNTTIKRTNYNHNQSLHSYTIEELNNYVELSN